MPGVDEWVCRLSLGPQTLKPLVPLQMPANKVRKGFWLIVNHPNFQNFITGVILFNIAIMTTEVPLPALDVLASFRQSSVLAFSKSSMFHSESSCPMLELSWTSAQFGAQNLQGPC